MPDYKTQEYRKYSITREEIVPLAQRKRAEGATLAMIHAFIDEKGLPNVSYEYEIPGGIESFTVEGEHILPSIHEIYDKGAEWPEREIMELMDIVFEGVDTSKRLFMPETMLSGQGQIIVTPMDKLIKKAHFGEEDK